jgi:AbrB family looped-hinge helix DNA binding protein
MPKAEITMRISDSGEVTIPADVRERAGLLPGTEVEFVVDGETVLLRRVGTVEPETRGDRAVRLLRGTGEWPAESTDEIMKLLRGE